MGEQADESLLALAKLLRRTYSDKREYIPVAEEMESLKNYLVLMEKQISGYLCVEYRGVR
mgnify:CR=1 FL=1